MKNKGGKEMSNRIKKRHSRSDPHMSNFAFRIISLMHDNSLLPYFRNPQRLLKAAGLKPGQKVLEVGCGPGFFTIPAAKIVGEEGFVYAVDVHPLAIERVKEKIEKEGIKNIKPILANASDTGLPDRSIDLAFLFGLQYVAGGLGNVIAEIQRTLKDGGVLSFEKTRGSAKKLIAEVERGVFIYSGRHARIFLFTKEK
uniref:2-methoxy-6-polyprenyl-1,4-benzoquinol methylase, mitochondrial n=1 Tax=Candidatus Methanophaga sp. ANME-1 ERB7 TaxID=2759913 RepID=A0A7G9Z3Q8_9EURY|nr:2-methoxy-6-polyprenyl-1,4-benzoquinol methylase, mitochondrial [Methanosarcinales archaeon ANME-1 ERB7]